MPFFRCAGQWVMVVRLDRTRLLNLVVKCASSCFVLLSLLARLGYTERSVRLARTTITSTPRSVNDVEVRSISNLLVDQGGLLPVRAMECQLFMWPALMAMNRATPSTRLQVWVQVRRSLKLHHYHWLCWGFSTIVLTAHESVRMFNDMEQTRCPMLLYFLWYNCTWKKNNKKMKR